jgi:hypothetical protein
MTKPKKAGKLRGTALVEFTLAGLASVVLLISTFELSIGMWNYHTLAHAVHQCTRYLAVKGVGCTLNGNSCSVTVGTITQRFAAVGIGLPSSLVNVTLTADSGLSPAVVCAPVNTCFASLTVWPPATNSDNLVGKKVTISAQYQFRNVLLFFWPGQGAKSYGSYWLPASSTQTIVF